jgi:hypothetical protein
LTLSHLPFGRRREGGNKFICIILIYNCNTFFYVIKD